MKTGDGIKQMSPDNRYAKLLAAMGGGRSVGTAEAALLGISRGVLSKWAKAGKVRRVARGVYQPRDAVPDDLEVLFKLAPNAVLSHESALYLLGLSERCPARHSVTLPTGTNPPRAFAGMVKAYYVKPGWLGAGLTRARTPTGIEVPCYDAERTLCDVLRSRGRIDEETLNDALRRYAAWAGKDLNRLAEWARLLRVGRVLRERMGAWL
jgi:predicted transcriptional regulator of viral defense system